MTGQTVSAWPYCFHFFTKEDREGRSCLDFASDFRLKFAHLQIKFMICLLIIQIPSYDILNLPN
jgi:hypothetical protein